MDRTRNDTPGTRDGAAQATGCEANGDQSAGVVPLSREIPLELSACSGLEPVMSLGSRCRGAVSRWRRIVLRHRHVPTESDRGVFVPVARRHPAAPALSCWTPSRPYVR